MKKRLLTIAVALVALTVAWTVYAAEGGAERPRRGAGGFGGMSAEERSTMRERFQNMSEEEREKFREEMRARFQNISDADRAQMRQRFGGRTRLSTEDQLKAIAAMEKHLAKLKASIVASSGTTATNFRDLSEEERAKLREKLGKTRADRESSIAALRVELEKLGPARSMPMQMGTVRELRVISGLAQKEKATETKKRIDALIAQQSQQFSPTRPGGRRPGGEPGARRGPREGADRRPSREGSDSDAPRRPSR